MIFELVLRNLIYTRSNRRCEMTVVTVVSPCTERRESHDIILVRFEVENEGILEGRNRVRSPLFVSRCASINHECRVTDEVVVSHRSDIEVTLYFELCCIEDNGYSTRLSQVKADIGIIICIETICGVRQRFQSEPLFSRSDEFELMRTFREVQDEGILIGLQRVGLAPSSFAFAYDILTTGDIILQSRCYIEVTEHLEDILLASALDVNDLNLTILSNREDDIVIIIAFTTDDSFRFLAQFVTAENTMSPIISESNFQHVLFSGFQIQN